MDTGSLEIRVENPIGAGRGVSLAVVDQTMITERPLHLQLVDDRATHEIQVRLG